MIRIFKTGLSSSSDSPEVLTAELGQQTSPGRRGFGPKSSGHRSPGGGASILANKRLTLPFLALVAVLAAGLLFLMPGGPLQAQDGGSGAGCEENAEKTGYDCEYAENGKDPVATFTATDPEGAAVSWDLDEGGEPDHALFAISKDGVLTFKSPPNYESGTDNMHSVTVRATDNMYDIDGVMGMVTTKTVTVTVMNVEEPGSVKLTVNGTTGQPVLQPQMGEALTATLSDGNTPVDAGIEWQWYRGSTEIIGATNGAGTMMSAYTPVQADIGEKLTAKATYTDGKNSNDKDMAEATTIMAVRAAPSTNSDPAFPDEDLSTTGVQKTPKRKVAENTPAGRNIGAPVKANDEGDVLAYSLGGTDADLFDIDIATGQLKTKGKLNREVTGGDVRMVTVTAVDPFGQTDTDGATVTIEIENVDESPAIDERMAKAKLMYAEPVGATADTPAPVLLWTYEATDDEDDASPVVPLEWKLEGRDRTKLAIDDDGMLKFMENPDFEEPADANKDNVYEVTVVVTDSDDLTDTLAVRVEVTNAKEAGEVTFTVGTPRVGVPLTAMLEDPDEDETGHEWQWRMADTADGAATAIDGATAATFTPLDRDLGKFLSVKVKYTDGKGKDEVTRVLATAVAASAVPRFYDKAVGEAGSKVVAKFEVEIDENTEPTFDPTQHKKKGPIHVGHRTDIDVLQFAVGGTDAAYFKVSTNADDRVTSNMRGTFQLEAQGPLDREEKASYAVTVTATDSDGNSTTLPVTVTVTPVDEMPVVSGSGAGCEENADETGYDCEYAENGKDPVATFTATDPEMAAVSWDLDTSVGADHALFDISKDGVLTFKSPPNYEASDTDNIHEVTVRATDNMYDITYDESTMAPRDPMDTTKLVKVEVTNVEEPGSVKLTVNGTNGQPVLQPQMGEELTATLSDGDSPTEIEWQWYRGSTEIIGATNGAGTMMSAYTPAESDIRSRLTAKAAYMDGEDANNKKMAEATTMMAVRRGPETNKEPEFPDQTPDDTVNVVKNQMRKVAENTPAGRNIGAPVRANDEGDVLAYSLSGTDAELFDIDIRTGQLKTKEKLNREATGGDERMVTVTAVDPFGLTDTADVTIEIENEDESPAIDERMAKAKLMYAEPVGATADTPAPVLLWTYEATDDEDDASPVVPLEWKLEGRDRTKLAIDDDGMLKFMENPDFEEPADANKDNVYEVTVVVTDSDDLTDTLAVRVEVTNAKEAGEVTFTVGTPRVGVPLTAMLEDPDEDETGHEWQWRMADTADGAATAIDGATAATFTPLDRDLGKFLSVKVKYTDGKGKDEVTRVLATAVAASAVPRFYDKAVGEAGSKVVAKFEVEIDENTEPTFDPTQHKKKGPIHVGHRTDIDVLQFAVGGTDAAYFKVSTNADDRVTSNMRGTFQLEAQGPLDREEKASYAVTVTATDSDGSSTTLPVTVTVTPVDEMPVVMLGGLVISGMSSVSYAEDRMNTVGTYRTVGPMADMASLRLEGDDAGDFMFSGGMLTFRNSPNYEMPMDANTDNTYMVTLKASDGTYTDTHDVMVRVTNVDEPGRVTFWRDGADATNAAIMVGDELGGAVDDSDGNPGDTFPIAMYKRITAGNITSWQWARSMDMTNWENIGTGGMYTVMDDDAGYYLRATATYTDGEGVGKTASEETMKVGAMPAEMTLLERYDDGDDGWIQLEEARDAVGDYFVEPKGTVLSLEDARKVVGLYFEYKNSLQ